MMRRLGLALAGLSVVALASVGADAQTLDTLPFKKKLALAKAGDEEAQVAVAAAYAAGKDVKVNKVEASKWYGKAADQGNADAQFKLATLFHEGGPGLKKSPERAAKLYEAAAKQDHVEAQNWLGYCYQHGLGVGQSDAKAVEWYRKAADAKLPMAENNLGLMYLSGKGVEQDYGKAFELFQRSANQGYDWGMNNLGGLYEKGWGTEQDMAKALFLYREAGTKGNEAAQKSAKRLEPLVIKTEANPSVQPAAGAPEKPTMTTPAAKAASDSSSGPKPLSAENPLEGKPKPPPTPEKTVKSDSSSE
ncbi:MAG: tetratricopeptide repeat protein [Parvibaculaceae bacterium]